ncbi:MAG: hypothetical protein NT027_04280 [Proteobacteria bacterium]|nr:hypothetical protein [Pseudomonadota bacterium]
MKKLMTVFFAVGYLVLLLNSSRSFANTWCHAFLKATDGSVLQLDYQVQRIGRNRGPDIYVMSNLYLHAQNDAFEGSENVSMVIMNPVNGSTSASSKELSKFSFNEGQFTGNANDIGNGRFEPVIRYDYPGETFYLEVAIVVDGIWLKDPISGTSNFSFNPNQYQNMCPNPF